METTIMFFAVPTMIAFILVEMFLYWREKKERYTWNDTINNFSTGVLEEISGLPLKGLIFFAYYQLYHNAALFHIADNQLSSWIVCFIAVDFCYYWFHRLSHRCTFLWIGHSVHHQSQYFNLSVSLRQGVVQAYFSWMIYLPLALLGFPPLMLLSVITLNTLYQFWVHTERVGHLGWFEKIFNTPSHHRVHHGVNPQYIDKNYAGSLIIWDKFFGTFEPEKETVRYGVTDPLDSWNPFYANIKVAVDIFNYGKFLQNPWKRILAFFMPPEWITEQEKKPSTSERNLSSRTQPDTMRNKTYALFNMIIILVLYAFISSHGEILSYQNAVMILLLYATLYSVGHIANRQEPSMNVELIRMLLFYCVLCSITPSVWVSVMGTIVWILINMSIFRVGKISLEHLK
jgi:sterol desaturase/sphingolipid hydroxylase (fatty acid hydroxylase superfamily)